MRSRVAFAPDSGTCAGPSATPPPTAAICCAAEHAKWSSLDSPLEEAVSSELVSGSFPGKLGKYREFEKFWPARTATAAGFRNKVSKLGHEFPTHSNREFYSINRELNLANRQFSTPIRQSETGAP